MNIRLIPVVLALLLKSATASADPVSFKKDIAPILLNNCLACHGPKKSEGGYRIDTFERATKEGDSGAPGFAAKMLDGSEGFRRLTTGDVKERMPLDGDPLAPEQIALIKQWIEEGATFDGPDPKAALSSIVPPPVHPSPPEAYPNTLPITAVAFSPDGSQLLVGGYNEITIWNAADGQLVRRIKNTGQRVFAIVYSPDGKTLAVASGAPGRLGEVRFFDPTSGELTKVLHSAADVVYDAAYSPAGDRLASASADGVLRVYDTASGAEQLAITSHSDWVTAVAWNADGTKLASASRDKTAKVFDAKTGELSVTYAGHNQPLKGVAFHADGAEAFSAGADNKIHQWKLADAAKSGEIGGFGGEVGKLLSDGGNLFAVSNDKNIRQFDRKSRNQIRVYTGHQDWALCVAYHEASKRLATGSFDGEVKIWNAEDGKPLVSFLAAPGIRAGEEVMITSQSTLLDELHDLVQEKLASLDELLRRDVPDVVVSAGRTSGAGFLLFTHRTYSSPSHETIDSVVVGLTFTLTGNSVSIEADASGESTGDMIVSLPRQTVALSSSAPTDPAKGLAGQLVAAGKSIASAIVDPTRQAQ